MKNVVMTLLAINIGAFILQMFLGDAFTDFFVLKQGDLFARPWTLLTSMFLHGDITHILFNMYVLFIFGPLLQSRIGAQRFLFVYLFSGIIAAVASSFIYSSALGASGAIMGMLGVVIVLMPRLKVLFFFVIPMPLWVAGIVIAGIDLVGAFNPSGIANVAHLVGMGCGIGYGFKLKEKRKKFNKRFHSRSHMDSDDVEEYIRSGRI